MTWIISGWVHLLLGFVGGILAMKYVPKLWASAVGVETAIEDKIRRKP